MYVCIYIYVPISEKCYIQQIPIISHSMFVDAGGVAHREFQARHNAATCPRSFRQGRRW